MRFLPPYESLGSTLSCLTGSSNATSTPVDMPFCLLINLDLQSDPSCSLLFSLRWGVVCITCLSHVHMHRVHVMKTGIKMAAMECQWIWRGWPSKQCTSRRQWHWACRSLNEDFFNSGKKSLQTLDKAGEFSRKYEYPLALDISWSIIWVVRLC